MGHCEYPCLGHCREKQCPLFDGDVQWLETQSRQRLSPPEYASLVARIVRIFRTRDRRCRSVGFRRREFFPTLMGKLPASGHQPELTNFAVSTSLYQPTLGKSTARIRCDFCGGLLEKNMDFITTRRDRRYHRLCFELLLNREQNSRRVHR